MSRLSHTGGILVVEGQDDLRFWLPRRHNECEVVSGEGKGNVVDGIRRLDATGFCGALGTVDDDHDSLESITISSPNVVPTDAHDLESLLCRSSALETVLAEFGTPRKIHRFEREQGTNVRLGLLKRGSVFGRVRWVAKRVATAVDTAEVRVARFLDERSWAVDEEALIRAADRESSDGSALSRSVAALPRGDPWYVTHGHDLIEILRIGLRRVLGDLSPTTGRAEIARVLRAAIPQVELRATNYGRSILLWEARNEPYAVLAA